VIDKPAVSEQLACTTQLGCLLTLARRRGIPSLVCMASWAARRKSSPTGTPALPPVSRY